MWGSTVTAPHMQASHPHLLTSVLDFFPPEKAALVSEECSRTLCYRLPPAGALGGWGHWPLRLRLPILKSSAPGMGVAAGFRRVTGTLGWNSWPAHGGLPPATVRAHGCFEPVVCQA